MSEWWTYTLSDFLMFSPGTYYRLFERYNAAIWPFQVATVGLGFAVLALLGRARGRFISAILAGCWLWVAVAFHANRYAAINWAAVDFAWGFGLEAALLLWLGVVGGKLAFDRPVEVTGWTGLLIFLFALAAEPMVGPMLGRSWRQVEIFGVAPDPTTVATLGILLLGAGRGRWVLIVVPAIWCAISGATLWAMKAPDAWIPPLSALLVVSLMISNGLRRLKGARP